jgi:hypothetical protein
MDAIMLGQYIEIAMVVNRLAMPGDTPLVPPIWEATAAKFPPGWASNGQMDCAMDTAVPGSPYDTPELVSADKKLSLTASARAGAAATAATAKEMANAPDTFAVIPNEPGLSVMVSTFLFHHEFESLP